MILEQTISTKSGGILVTKGHVLSAPMVASEEKGIISGTVKVLNSQD